MSGHTKEIAGIGSGGAGRCTRSPGVAHADQPRRDLRIVVLAIAAALTGAMAGWSVSPAWAAGAAPGGRVIRFGADFTEPPGQVIIDGKMA
ncbi:MAG: hypothetical protein ACREFN_15290, partial [Acetobacteraceae bacterium]